MPGCAVAMAVIGWDNSEALPVRACAVRDSAGEGVTISLETVRLIDADTRRLNLSLNVHVRGLGVRRRLCVHTELIARRCPH
jgi:hypothetical protein